MYVYNKPTKKIKWNHKYYSIKEQEKVKKEHRTGEQIESSKSNLNLNILVIPLNINSKCSMFKKTLKIV